MGTVDSYLVARMTRGLHHVTDPSNASRTLLYDLHTGDWSPELLEMFGVPRHALPDIVSSYGVIGNTDPSCFLGLDLPIASILGDQQAALFGQGCFTRGLEQVHVRHGVLRPGQHGRGDRGLALGPADHRGLAAPRRPP